MAVKTVIKNILLNSNALRLKQCFLPQSVLILYYHSISPDRKSQASYITTGITIETDYFREQMRTLKRDYHPITLDEMYEWVQGRIQIPRRSVVVTFDDGFEDNYQYAAPIMEEFGMRGTFYLTTRCVERQTLPWFCKILYLFGKAKEEKKVFTDSKTGEKWDTTDPEQYSKAYSSSYLHPCAKLSGEEQDVWIERLESDLGIRYDENLAPKMMSWQQARELVQRGHIIGNHTYSHPNVAHLSPENQKNEIRLSHELLSKNLEIPPVHFSYPHPCLSPQWDVLSQEQILELGYKTIVLTEFGSVNQQSLLGQLGRVTVGQWGTAALRWKLETAFAGIKI